MSEQALKKFASGVGCHTITIIVVRVMVFSELVIVSSSRNYGRRTCAYLVHTAYNCKPNRAYKKNVPIC